MNVDESRKYMFYEGQELKAIKLGDMWCKISTCDMTHDSYSCVSITVIMDYGHMGFSPWAVVKCHNGSIEKYNLALVTGVVLKEEKANV